MRYFTYYSTCLRSLNPNTIIIHDSFLDYRPMIIVDAVLSVYNLFLSVNVMKPIYFLSDHF